MLMTDERPDTGAIPSERTCSDCGETWPLDAEHFAPAKRYKYGFKRICRNCDRRRTSEWQKEHPEQTAERRRNWYNANNEHGKEYQRDRYSKMSEAYRIAREQGLIE